MKNIALDELDVHHKVIRYLTAMQMCRMHMLKGTVSPAWMDERMLVEDALAAEGICWTGEVPASGAPDYGRFNRHHLSGYNPLPDVGMRLQKVVDGLTPLDVDQERANLGSPFDTMETAHINGALAKLGVRATREQVVTLWSLISAEAHAHWITHKDASEVHYWLEEFALLTYPTWDKGYGPVSSGDVPYSSLQT